MTPRRRFRPFRMMPVLVPATVVRRIAKTAGTPYARALVTEALGAVERSGDAGLWIVEVQRARDAGVISAEVAWFLIYKLAESAMLHVIGIDPEIMSLGERIDAIERAYGLEEDDSFYVDEGPPEWQEATRQWEAAFDARFAAILRRFGEEEMASDVREAGDDARFETGRMAVIGIPLDDVEDKNEGRE